MGLKISAHQLNMCQFPPHTQWDIFCKVIDNYGDIGVCWRLARQLANEQKQQIRLWVDDLRAFEKICPEVNPELNQQSVAKVTICHWQHHWKPITPADIVIEAFACELPKDYIQAMSEVSKPIFWINLEYLTYEHWSIDFHALPSLQPNQRHKYFFFPGLPETGGLIREQQILKQAEDFQCNTIAQQTFLQNLQINKHNDSLLMLVFSYANCAISEWFDTLKQSQQHFHLLIPPTPLLQDIANYLQIDRQQLTPGYHIQRDNLTLQIIPFINQIEFDKLLWCTDYNLIRGEDSFVRAQYAGKPMLWHIYPQKEDTHLIKLEAFLSHYLEGLPSEIQQIIKNWWLAWSNQENLSTHWPAYYKQLPLIKKHAQQWAKKQKTVTDLTTKLAKLYKNSL